MGVQMRKGSKPDATAVHGPAPRIAVDVAGRFEMRL